MLIIDNNNNISLTRSDTCNISLSVLNDDGTEYDYSNDLVQLTIKGSTNTNDVIIQKNIDINSFKILPDDTKNLDYGIYKYDVQIITESNDVFTVIGPCDFVLLGEVNFNVSRSN